MTLLLMPATPTPSSNLKTDRTSHTRRSWAFRFRYFAPQNHTPGKSTETRRHVQRPLAWKPKERPAAGLQSRPLLHAFSVPLDRCRDRGKEFFSVFPLSRLPCRFAVKILGSECTGAAIVLAAILFFSLCICKLGSDQVGDA